MTVEFECRTPLAMPVEEAFARSLDIDVHAASMARSRERAIGGVTSGSIGLGEEVTWRAWHFGVPIRMTSRITELEAPHWFVDEQVRGPFRSFRHEHAFVADGNGTLMIDHVVFEAPLGGLGRAAEAFIGPHLVRLIERRNAYLGNGPVPEGR
ncbi:hypothetical protein EV187_1927 [Agromyces ramosus]|uniref:Cyclase n=1 Tax=Agromyces ramosus TaxID=33879 RepID=A0A4Q7MGE5_9MICO|nr:SRPBCC family protein [Agromyces ramosus]RZS66208.1 hypothetical protein EV187_1927 [Agromyces ramosus]